MRRPSPRGGRAPDRTRSHQQFALLPRCVAERLSLRRLAVRGAHFREAATRRGRCAESSATVVARYVSADQLECATPAQAGAGSRAVEVSLHHLVDVWEEGIR